ncbi:MAG: HD-GYP domain-containing protein [Candidatus Alkaliphilus sp. MAG34]|nr:HD domain-containing protein [Bacillota bacterium]NMA03614.1 HD domain-containing protein [Clostridiales bacterium]
MIQNNFKISFSQLVSALSEAVDLVCPVLNNHHKQVAYISYRIAKALNFPNEKLADLVIAGLLHDTGALGLDERIDLLDFEEKDAYRHTINGYILLKDLEIFKKAGEIIKHHHLPWANGAGTIYRGDSVHPESHILYLSDRIAVSIDRNIGILYQVKDILRKIKNQANSRFHPQFVSIFEELGATKTFWLDVVSLYIDDKLGEIWKDFDKQLDLEELLEVTKVFARIIDSRSRFTAIHSSGVEAVARIIAQKMNWSERDCIKMAIAGNLHDLGKLAIPDKILEKPGKLTTGEYKIMRSHAYHGYRLLNKIEGLEEINRYGSFHHERIDGSGYPFQLEGGDLEEGSKIMAIADVLTATTEDRPYRKGMEYAEAMGIIEKMGQDSKLDTEIIALVKENSEEINFIREKAQQEAAKKYRDFDSRIHLAKNYYSLS